MCLAIPGKVVEIRREDVPVMGKVDFGGIRKDVCLEWLPEVQVGEYVVVHVGFAISKMNEEEAMETLQLLREAGKAWEELDPPGDESSGPGGDLSPGTGPDSGPS